MFNPSRDEVRRFFTETWAKYTHAEPLEGLERTALAVILLHPEYHALLADPDRSVASEYTPEGGELNPFLHLSLHLAIEEQISIDQPRGIRQACELLAARLGSMHAAQHEAMECLGRMLWDAQRSGRPPDVEAYIECVRRRAGGG